MFPCGFCVNHTEAADHAEVHQESEIVSQDAATAATSATSAPNGPVYQRSLMEGTATLAHGGRTSKAPETPAPEVVGVWQGGEEACANLAQKPSASG